MVEMLVARMSQQCTQTVGGDCATRSEGLASISLAVRKVEQLCLAQGKGQVARQRVARQIAATLSVETGAITVTLLVEMSVTTSMPPRA